MAHTKRSAGKARKSPLPPTARRQKTAEPPDLTPHSAARSTAPPQELEFDDDDQSTRSATDVRQRFPHERVIEAGRTGGEVPHADVTADDASPETLLDDDPSRTPTAYTQRASADSILTIVSGSAIGTGDGPDEAEMAELDPVGREEARRLQSKSRRHAQDARYLEPAAAKEALARASPSDSSTNDGKKSKA